MLQIYYVVPLPSPPPPCLLGKPPRQLEGEGEGEKSCKLRVSSPRATNNHCQNGEDSMGKLGQHVWHGSSATFTKFIVCDEYSCITT